MFSGFLKKNKASIPAYEEKRFFLREDEIFYGRLLRALPNCYIFPQVELSAIMEPLSINQKQKVADLDQLQGRKVDYAIFDASLGLLCVIELSSQVNPEENTASNAEYLKSAGIKNIRWGRHPLPSYEQILRTLAPFSSLESPKPDIAASTIIRTAYAETGKNLDTVQVMYQSDPEPSNILGLSVAALEKLAPQGHIKKRYPHVWQRICLFCSEPKHLKKYLATLFLQDRGVERAGFPPEVIKEITDIQSENERFLNIAAPQTTWGTSFRNL